MSLTKLPQQKSEEINNSRWSFLGMAAMTAAAQRRLASTNGSWRSLVRDADYASKWIASG